jgi:hypothetical protein
VICWLAGYPKSGNTWLRLLLANWFSDEPIGINETGKVGLDLQDTDPLLWGDLVDADPGVQLRNRAEILRQIHVSRPGTTFCKTHSARGVYKQWEMIPSDVTHSAIYMVRDPRDVAVSLANHLQTSVDKAIRTMNSRHATMVSPDGVVQYLGDWSANVNSWMASCTIVKYEDLLNRAEFEFAQILEYLGQNVVVAKMRAVIDECGFDHLRSQEIGQGFNEGHGQTFFNNGKSVWRDVLSESQEKRIRRRRSKVMKALGYI